MTRGLLCRCRRKDQRFELTAQRRFHVDAEEGRKVCELGSLLFVGAAAHVAVRFPGRHVLNRLSQPMCVSATIRAVFATLIRLPRRSSLAGIATPSRRVTRNRSLCSSTVDRAVCSSSPRRVSVSHISRATQSVGAGRRTRPSRRASGRMSGPSQRRTAAMSP